MAKSKFRQAKGYKEDLKKRTERLPSSSFVTIWKDDNLPFFKEKNDVDYGIDIIPYLASANNPHDPEGKATYILELWVHQRCGPENGDYVCLRNYSKPCPLCEAYGAENSKTEPRKDVKDALSASQRGFYNVLVVDPADEEAKGVQIWHSSVHLAEKEFKGYAKNRKTGEKIAFADPDEGRTIYFTPTGSKFEKKFAGIEFVERDPLSDELLDEVFIIEDYILIPEHDELARIAKIVLGSGRSFENDEETPPSSRRRGRSTEPDDGGEEDPPPSRTRRGRASVDEGTGEMPDFDKDKEEQEPDNEPEPEKEQEQEEERPARTRRSRSTREESSDEDTTERRPGRRRIQRK